MVMNLLVIVLVGVTAFIWFTRGFFGALLNMACVLIAAAIAFAAWEPLAYLILEKVPGNKGFLSFLPGMAWGIALVVPFALSLGILRVVVDKAVPANVVVGKLAERIGGGVCGLISGIVTSGIIVLGISALWTSTGWWYQRLVKDDNGRLESTARLWVPVDDIVEQMYGRMSRTTLSTEYSLARLYPDLADVPSSLRHSLFDGEGRPTLSPGQFRVLGGWTVGADEAFNSALIDQGDVQAALGSSRNPFKPVLDRQGERLDVPGSYVVGYALEFESAARERGSSQVVFGVGQVRLVCENDVGDSIELFPFAFVTRAEAQDVQYLRYDFLDGDFPATYQENTPKLGFEFFVPGGYRPAWLYAKNSRVDVRSVEVAHLTPAQRQTRVGDKSLVEMTRPQFDSTGAVSVATAGGVRGLGVVMRTTLPLSMVLQDGNQRSLQLNDSKQIVAGEQSFDPSAMDNRALDKALRVNQFGVPEFSSLVQVTITPTNRTANPAVNLTELPLSSAPPNEPISLVDSDGYSFACIGYVYKDRQQVRIRYTRSDVLSGLKDLPSVPSRSRRDQEIVLLFEVQQGKHVAGLAIGNKIYVTFDPPFEVTKR